MKRRLFTVTVLLCVLTLMLGAGLCAAQEVEEQTVKPITNVGDVVFYLLSAVLVVVVLITCFVFTKSKRFKVKMRERMLEQKDNVKLPTVIRVNDAACEIDESKK